MKVEVEIPKGKKCTGCPFSSEALHSFGYEETYWWCSYLKESLTEPSAMPPDEVKKHKGCPANASN